MSRDAESTTIKAVPKLYDVIVWILSRVEKFPRAQKFTLGDRIVNLALDTLHFFLCIGIRNRGENA